MKGVDPFNVVVACSTVIVLCYFVCKTILAVYGVTL